MPERLTVEEYAERHGISGKEAEMRVSVDVDFSKSTEDHLQALAEAEGLSPAAQALAVWWTNHDLALMSAGLEKAIDYSGSDLEFMGGAMRMMASEIERSGIEASHGLAYYMEKAILFYVVGKIARLMGGFNEGRLPNVDSWLDLEVYAKMAQKIRETGRWL